MSKAAFLNQSVKRGRREGGQMAIWEEIDRKSEVLGVASPTVALADVYEQRRAEVQSMVEAVKPEPTQVGAVFAIGPRVLGCDVFDAPRTLAAHLPRLVRSWALDVLETADARPDPADVARFVESLREAQADAYPAVGLGTDLRIEGAIVGGALVEGEKLVHLTAFGVW